ncbi:MAG: zinc ribbon domain-containing protein [Limnospira sp. PMC 1279.21]|uniref:zinc ribbon domain-containing protein n=1 Tax=unclassified Limnospira TaxID=2642885 RepID=UPI000DC281FA|nr:MULTISPECIES: zinc ribbon domain-containing protein [unclassified Limnospira]RAQ39621.1 zinc ribbon domain-containing protein [Arthrospira sp. O9.13F]MDT9178313.1 zinc ribbon domain-containing protein [Limnospira sp. PMC 1238.20]MDT9193535.1 zinc ribbon domain-containing protein [Limnospira sp. PMC 1245.20]MDT9203777.1 zinc ribbon domain-containing protein [Limnospira sp. PMC 1243.20]MDT9208995.1 zinc ribbon domain-containing protein [Limnospira sp. PMC 1252.20]
MPECPRCRQPVDSQAIACPYCKYELKAFGHPGIPLHRADQGEFLCQSCLYHEDDTCNFPKRPYARECTLYQDRSKPILPQPFVNHQGRFPHSVGEWVRRNALGVAIVIIIIISVLLAL